MKRALLAGLLIAAAPIAALSAQVWDATVARTEMGFRMGNPEAPTEMIAFVSYTCPHCANFEMESDAELRLSFIQPGKLNVEVRSFIRNPVDLTLTLAAQCGGDSKFWGNHHALLAQQSTWLPKAVAVSPERQSRWRNGTFISRMRAIASDIDLYEIMESRGYSVAQLDQCLDDQASAEQIYADMRANADQYEITGTPSFVIDNKLAQGVHSWGALRPKLASATE